MNTAIDITNVTLKTERLTLRPFKESDLDDLYEYAKVDGVGQMAGWMPHKNKEESKFVLNKFIQGKKTFAIEKDGKVIGSIGIEKYDEEDFPEFNNYKTREIGIVLSKEFWGQGLASEATKKVVDYCFNVLDLQILCWGYFLWNSQSKRVQEKLGFKFFKETNYETRLGTIEKNQETILINPKYGKTIKLEKTKIHFL